MPALGTAPHRVSPGVWVTAGGRTLTPAGGAYWEHHFRAGLTDGRGHVTHPSIMLAPPTQPRTPTVKPYDGPPKAPDFKTALRARKGDPQARKQIAAYARHQQATKEAAAQINEMISAQFGGVEQIAAKANKVINPLAGSVLESLSPSTALEDAYHAGRHGNVLGAGLAAASILPIGRGAKAAKAAEDALKAERAAKAAEEIHPAVAQVRGIVQPGKAAYDVQAGMRTAGRKANIAKAEESNSYWNAGGGEAGYLAKIGHHRGPLPRADFQHLVGIQQEHFDHLMNLVENHPDLSHYDKIGLQGALREVRGGKVPTPSQIALVEKAFGSTAADEFAKAGPSAWRHVLDAVNIPRAVMTAFDVSGGLRQALVALAHRPGIVSKEFGKSFRYLFSEANYDRDMAALEADPLFATFEKHGGRVTDLGTNAAAREEYYPSKIAEKIPGIRASGRAFTGFLNQARFLIWKDMYEGAHAAGAFERTADADKLARQIANFANLATGRGGLGKLAKIAPELNTVFFAPRLMSARMTMLNPLHYARLDPYVRRQELLAMSKLIAAGTAFLTGLAYAGAKVGLDPRNPDFGKAKFGNTRIDLWGGHQPFVRVMAQLLTGTAISSTTGKKVPLKGGYFGRSRFDVVKRFTEGKFSPPAAFVDAWFNGTDAAGKPFSVKRQILQDVWPLVAQDATAVAQQSHSPLWGVGAYGLAGLGVGVQSYGVPAKKVPKSRTIEGRIDKAFHHKSVEDQINAAFQGG